jgi:hypothetical protein
MPQVRKKIQIVDKGKVRFIQINHGVTLGLAANVGTLVRSNEKNPTIARQGSMIKCRVNPTLAGQGVTFYGLTIYA